MFGRLLVIEPYHPVVEIADDESHHKEIPPHKHLFHCYVYQYHLIQVASVLVESVSAQSLLRFFVGFVLSIVIDTVSRSSMRS